MRRGLLASLPLTVLAAWYFQASHYRAQNELAFAASALAIALVCGWAVWCRTVPSVVADRPAAVLWLIGAATVLLVVRQMMEVGALLGTAVFEVRSRDATLSILEGATIGIIASWSCARFGQILPSSVARAAVRAFAVVFVGQLVLYSLHEAAEAGLVPFSDAVHTATETYGPDGIYGVHFSDLLVLVPLCVALWVTVLPHVQGERVRQWRLSVQQHVAASLVVVAGVVLTGMQRHDAERPPAAAPARPEDIAAVVRQPHLIFRSTSPGQNFGRLTVAPLNGRDYRLSGSLACERVSFAGERGLCLHTDRSLFNSYTAFEFDETLKVGASVKLQGIPSRTRISASGGVGAITVFVIGDNYAAQFDHCRYVNRRRDQRSF